LLDRPQVRQKARPRAAQLGREGECEHVVLAQQLDAIPRELGRLVHLGGARRDRPAGEPAHRLEQHLLLLGLRERDADGGHTSISSLGAVVRASQPPSVTRYMSSMPTAPRPGNTNFGSTATTFPASSGASKPGASTGCSSISMP